MGQDQAYYRAMLARDARFDGKFFVGVKTTGIYCRPVCPARPKRRNVEFFPDARSAENAGYRPCLRCRPEAAPDSAAWNGSSALVQRALRALAESGHEGVGEEAFAARFGLGARQLRRVFLAEVGKTPARIAADRRLDFARKLIAETGLPMARIAGSAGFASVRRFNAAIRERFRRSPTEMRRHRRGASESEGVELSLPFRPPFDWDASLDYYRSHAIDGLEAFSEGAYERLFRFGSGPAGHLRVSLGTGAKLRLQVRGGDVADLGRAARAVRRMFDLDADPAEVAAAFAGAPGLDRLLRLRPGLRAPRGWDAFETAVCAVLGQLVSIPQANRLIAQLIEAYGEPVAHPLGGTARLFPRPESLADSDLARVGTTGARKAALRELAARVAAGNLSFSSAQDPIAFRASLRSIKGIGPWTAEYVSLRALGDVDAFPAADLVLQRAIASDPGLDPERVRPWRGYAAAHLWRAWTLARRGENP
ncbi:MAG: DNA-3-methyladenine glycosylase 2 family protein [Fibrobacteres bacterium]|nr:DNA-3-methyladenine glycosylase 2 family protein [Fibrobacterota bacterium]